MSSYYANRGGRSSFGDGCGIFYIDLRTLSSNTGWISDAALSLLHIIIFDVAVFLTLIQLVGLFLLMPVEHFLILVGTLALL